MITINDNQAKTIAEDFVESHESPFLYEFQGVNRSPKFPNEANVCFVVSDRDGKTFDGPVVVIVNELEKTARFFEGL